MIIQYFEYQNKPLSTSKANAICSNAWHLNDWVFNEYQEHHKYDKIGEFRNMLYQRCPYFRVMHDLSNTHKHGKLSRPMAKIKEVREQGSPFSPVFTNNFGSPSLIIELDSGKTLKFIDVIDSVVDFWIYYFKEELKTPKNLMSISMDKS